MPSDPPLDYFIHLGGDPMIMLGDILIRDDVQGTITRLLNHVGSPLPRSIQSRSSSHRRSSAQSRSRASLLSSIGSRTGTHISITDSPTVSAPVPDISALDDVPSLPLEALLPSPIATVSSLDPPTPITRNPTTSLPTPIAQPATHSSRFPNVDPSMFRTVTPHVTVFHGQRGTPIQTSVPKSSFSVPPIPPQASPSVPVDAPWDQFSKS